MYKNYIFDLYGTLIDLETDEENKELWEKLSLFYSYNGAKYKFDELKKNYKEEAGKEIKNSLKFTKYPDIEILKVFEKLYFMKGKKATKKLVSETSLLFRILSSRKISLYDGVLELLKELKKRKKKIFLLSNGQRSFSISELKYFDIYKYFNGIYFSSDINICKPDEKFYNYLIKKEKLDKKSSIMIGNDYTTDIKGANNIGIDSYYIHTNYSPKLIKNIGATYTNIEGEIIDLLRI
ncbi:HAD family hydrolase [Haliovirga abyssi]|uniref:Haloacid dehalogenase n=1 Tax=Haliovirga abyssi TaxID=2996794 RepID=A0AAU9DEB8_9FUSO|nr:HAD family hydrolase [Haliovirga abyssi]BDU50543.1 haloacid dehalogenase [Haliovirga abyssi]